MTANPLQRLARTGLRTLVVAYREIGEEEYTAWKASYDEAYTAIENREEMVRLSASLLFPSVGSM